MKTQNILVPTNFSESAYKALLHAATMAGELNATIHLVHVTNYFAGSFVKTPEVQQIMPDAYSSFWQSKKTQLETTKRWVREKFDVPIETHLLEGNISGQLKNYTQEADIDLVILHDQHKKSLWKKLFGTKTAILQKELSVPVLTLLEVPGQPFEWSDVVIPITDFVPETRINTIAAFAERFRFTIHLVALRALGRAGRPLHILVNSLQAIKARYNARVVCREIQGKQLHEAAMAYADEIQANALMENNRAQKAKKNLWQRITGYFDNAEYPYLQWI